MNKHTPLLLFLLFLSIAHVQANESGRFVTLRGTVVSAADGSPVGFALVASDDQQFQTVCDINGRFVLSRVPAGQQLRLHVTCLGFNPTTYTVDMQADREFVFRMAVASIALKEVEVMAGRTTKEKLTVGRAAIEYIQPTSLADIFVLLPGNIHRDNNMGRFMQISTRQVGSDANTSLGVAVVADGAPISNDGMRTQLIGVTDNTSSRIGDTEIRNRTGMNRGVDMRLVSTDHIQSIEFVRGIASPRYGNLSDGLISVRSKRGVTPFNVRMKTELKNKLAYVGKGFKLSEHAGTLHLGADWLHTVDDIREATDQFSRVTAQAFYSNQLRRGDATLDLEMKLNQTLTVGRMKKDELIDEYDERYEADYSRTALSVKADLTTGRHWVDRVELILSSDLVNDRIKRHKMVISSSGPLSVPLAKEPGEHEGRYLPGKYYSDFRVENRPLNTFVQLHATSSLRLTDRASLRAQYGADFRHAKNFGDGAIIEDEARPPFPYDNSYMRPRKNSAIPALAVGAAYALLELRYETPGGSRLRLSAGGRISHMFNLDAAYALAHRTPSEPRLNASFTFGGAMRNTLRVGFGMENKFPTLDYLYPDRIYKDFYMLNAYTDREDLRRLITFTDVFDVTNHDLRENRNRKIEVGWDATFAGFDLFVTAFYEKTTSGFEYFTVYRPLTYDLYNTLRPGADISGRVPQKEDYIKERYSLFTTYPRVMNSRKTEKRGVEYRLILPRIEPLATTVELNGAYYRTNYGSSQPEYYRPDLRIADRPYPYVGIYATDPQQEYRRLNTNIWLNTHIPKFKLIFTNYLQFVWLNTQQYRDTRQKFPYAYMDLEGRTHTVTPAERDRIDSDDMTFRHLKKTVLPIRYARDAKPITFLWNIKATKEFNRYAQLSFFVNGILDIHPKYISGEKTTEREWTDPYFGLELLLNLN